MVGLGQEGEGDQWWGWGRRRREASGGVGRPVVCTDRGRQVREAPGWTYKAAGQFFKYRGPLSPFTHHLGLVCSKRLVLLQYFKHPPKYDNYIKIRLMKLKDPSSITVLSSK